MEDSGLMFSWRNHPDTRRYFIDPGPLERDEHAVWLVETLGNPAKHLLIAINGNDESVGVLRFDKQDDGATYEVSIYLDPARTNQGLGKETLAAGIQWLRENTDGVTLCATVLEQNIASQRLFAALDFMTVRSGMELEIKR